MVNLLVVSTHAYLLGSNRPNPRHHWKEELFVHELGRSRALRRRLLQSGKQSDIDCDIEESASYSEEDIEGIVISRSWVERGMFCKKRTFSKIFV